MQIDNARLRSKAPKMSAFPRKVVPFSEPVSATANMTLGPGLTIPDLIKRYYPGTVPMGFSGKLAFLDRDNKERTYDPAKEDGIVFKNLSSINEFSTSALSLIKLLCQMWTDMGYSLKRDDLRQIDLPDSSEVWKLLAQPSSPDGKKVIANMKSIQFILGNVDIMKKAAIVRTVNAGWWAVSYKAKASVDKDFFSMSLNAHRRAIATIVASPKFKNTYEKLWQDAGDPLDTNPGYPFFTAQIDKDGNPVTRIKTVELLKGVGQASLAKWSDAVVKIDNQAGRFGMQGFPLCVAPLRRQQPGYKPQHQFNITPSGMTTAFDEYGVNSQRVAWMVPYIYNVMLTPFQIMLKGVRSILPGLYHDGESKLKRTAILQQAAASKSLFMAEADYSNYDRFIPIDIMEEIIKMFSDLTDSPSYWHEAAMYLHRDANLVWPDFSSVSEGNGWLFKPGDLGLMSGVKATSEAGTLVNSVINAEVLARTYKWDENRLVDYLTQYLDSSSGSKFEYYYVQSDDTELIAKDPISLFKQGEFFTLAVTKAGLKGSVELADRFLMRHTYAGDDRPVPSRVWQNTLSNESPPENEIIFLAGLASRTDGMLGMKTVDPFQTGSLQSVTATEALYTIEVIKNLKQFLSTAATPSKTGILILDTFLKDYDRIVAAYKNDPQSLITPNKTIALKLNELRKEVSVMLANFEMSKNITLNDSWLYQLFKDRNIPSSQLIVDQLTAMNASLGHKISEFAAKEHAFFIYSANTVGIRKLSF